MRNSILSLNREDVVELKVSELKECLEILGCEFRSGISRAGLQDLLWKAIVAHRGKCSVPSSSIFISLFNSLPPPTLY